MRGAPCLHLQYLNLQGDPWQQTEMTQANQLHGKAAKDKRSSLLNWNMKMRTQPYSAFCVPAIPPFPSHTPPPSQVTPPACKAGVDGVPRSLFDLGCTLRSADMMALKHTCVMLETHGCRAERPIALDHRRCAPLGTCCRCAPLARKRRSPCARCGGPMMPNACPGALSLVVWDWALCMGIA